MSTKRSRKKKVTVEEEELLQFTPDTPIEELARIKGIGQGTILTLKDLGCEKVGDLVFIPEEELKGRLHSSQVEALLKLIAQISFRKASEYLEYRKRSVKYITTGVESLDKLLGGGVQTQAITEFYGEFGTGKTQICHQLCVTVQLPEEKGGLGKGAIYIDTENTFRPNRIVRIAQRFGLDPKKVLDNVIFAHAYNTSHQMSIVKYIKDEKLIEKRNIGLVIVDSLMNHFRAEYPGRENLARRQQLLNKHLHDLSYLAEKFNIAVVITNHVMAQPDAILFDSLKAVGGHVLGHTSTYRVFLRKVAKSATKRIAKIEDAPDLPSDTEVVFFITDEGVVDKI